MYDKEMKCWTILIYANGNNELEPEMSQALLDAEKIGSSKNINLIIQLGREDRELVKIFRPLEVLPEVEEKWTGVRRYYITKNNFNINGKNFSSKLIKDLGNINLAEPKELYDFIKWGIESYPAQRYMLIIGGHGFQYVGTLTDYSQNLPYIMTIPEMCKAINMIKRTINKVIDILIIDACYMNYIEVMYELTKEDNQTVKKMLTYIDEGPMGGIPLNKLIRIIESNITVQDSNEILKKVINDLNLDLVALELNRKKIRRIKKMANDLANNININVNNKIIELSKILMCDNPINPWYEAVMELKKNLLDLVVHFKRVQNQEGLLINIAHKKSSNISIQYYFQLSFTKNNKWTNLFRNSEISKQIFANNSNQLRPKILPIQAIWGLISVMNSKACENELKSIYKRLLEYKSWYYFDLK